MFKTDKITEILTDISSVYAFRIEAGVRSKEMAQMAEFLDAAFDRQGTISILLLLHDFRMTDALRSLSFKTLATQARSISHVERYAVVGAPKIAAVMVETFDPISPIKARSFEQGAEEAAWDFVGARPQDSAMRR